MEWGCELGGGKMPPVRSLRQCWWGEARQDDGESRSFAVGPTWGVPHGPNGRKFSGCKPHRQRSGGKSSDEPCRSLRHQSIRRNAMKHGARNTTARRRQLLTPEESARFCGMSVRVWWWRESMGLVPASARVEGGIRHWWLAELCRWCEAGCPSRVNWEFVQRERRMTRERQL